MLFRSCDLCSQIGEVIDTELGQPGLDLGDPRLELGEPLLSSTLVLPGDELPLNDAREMRERLEHQVDLILECGSCGIVPTTVIDLTGPSPVVTRQGRGGLQPFGL